MSGKFRIVLAFLVFVVFAAIWTRPYWLQNLRKPVTLRTVGRELTIAATGDTLLLRPLPSLKKDIAFRDAIAVVQSSSVGVTNLDESLLDSSYTPPQTDSTAVTWPHGGNSQAEDLRALGFSVISLANNHALDYGYDGLALTSKILDRVGLLHTGSGQDLTQARTPAYIGTKPDNRVAVLSVAISASSESRATSSRGEIVGRPGIRGMKYSPIVTLDPVTFSTLRHSNAASRENTKADANQFVLSGTLVRLGELTMVQFIPDADEINALLSDIKMAHTKANLVVIMLHSHEPANRSQTPADFVQRLARQMIDAGANLVIGQGPHQLRGIEVYKGAAILYSLGNFFFDYSEVNPQSADVYDAGADLSQLALGNFAGLETLAPPRFEEPVWWQSAIAVASSTNGILSSLTLRPIDLGVDVPLTERGTPRLATGHRADEILQRLSDLSKPFGTRLRIDKGVGHIVLADVGRQ
jgi:poly-gamma-glutamate capsule biosynthesis protein CapA/YwtB (metallophosphatase superfamily)